MASNGSTIERLMDQLRKLPEGTHPADIEQIERYIKARPAMAVINILSDAEVDERLVLATKIQDTRWSYYCPTPADEDRNNESRSQHRLSKFDIAAIMLAPHDVVTTWANSDDGGNTAVLLLTHLVRLFLQRPDTQKLKAADVNTTVATAKSVPRNRSEAEKCRMRDGNTCVLTKTANPEMCHFFPYAANSTFTNFQRLVHVRPAIGHWTQLPKLLTSQLGSSDYAWNMISLSPQLHAWWSKGMWAFKCLEVRPTEQNEAVPLLQFHWMPAAKPGSTRERPWEKKISLDAGEGKAVVGEWKQAKQQLDDATAETSRTVAAFDCQTGRPLRSGQTIEIRLPASDAPKMQAMIDIQWACIQLATMSGAAGCPEFLVDEDDDDDEMAELELV